MADDGPITKATPDSQGFGIPSELLARVRGEYREMPGLHLTLAQAARLWGLTPDVCATVLRALVAEGTLTCTREVHFVATATAPGSRRGAPGG